MKEKSEDVGVWGFQDAAKAVREIFKIIDDLVARGGKVVSVYRRHQRRKAARALDVLRFKEGNFLPVLRKMAYGDFMEADIIKINEILDRTRPDVEDSRVKLRGLAHFIREHIGITSAMKLEDIIDGERGKDEVRYSLADLANMTIGSNRRAAVRDSCLPSDGPETMRVLSFRELGSLTRGSSNSTTTY